MARPHPGYFANLPRSNQGLFALSVTFHLRLAYITGLQLLSAPPWALRQCPLRMSQQDDDPLPARRMSGGAVFVTISVHVAAIPQAILADAIKSSCFYDGMLVTGNELYSKVTVLLSRLWLKLNYASLLSQEKSCWSN